MFPPKSPRLCSAGDLGHAAKDIIGHTINFRQVSFTKINHAGTCSGQFPNGYNFILELFTHTRNPISMLQFLCCSTNPSPIFRQLRFWNLTGLSVLPDQQKSWPPSRVQRYTKGQPRLLTGCDTRPQSQPQKPAMGIDLPASNSTRQLAAEVPMRF